MKKELITMQRFFSVLLAITGFAVLLASCAQAPSPKATGSLSLALDGSSRTVAPDSTAYICVSYNVSGIGPESATFLDQDISGPAYTRAGLLVGEWTILVQGENSNGHVIMDKSFPLTIVGGQTASSAVLLERTAGNGTLSFNAHWVVAADFTSASGTLTPIGGSSQTLSLSISGGNQVVYSQVLAAGDYLLNLSLSGAEADTKTEVFQIYEGFTSSVDWDMSVNVAPGGWVYTSSSPVYPVDFEGGTAKTIDISGLAGRSLYLVKANVSSAAAIAANTGSAASQFSVVPYDKPLAILQPEFIPDPDKLVRMEHRDAALFNANPPLLSELKNQASPKTLPGMERQDATSYGTIDPLLTVGTSTKTFWVQNASNAWVQITATLRAAGQYCYVWVANGNYGATSTLNNDNLVTTSQAQALVNKFDGTGPNYTDGIFKNVTNIFGYEFGGGTGGTGGRDADQHIAILLYDVGYDYSSGQTGGILGYFWGKDYYTQVQMDPNNIKTNYAEIFYIDAHFTDRYPTMIISTLAHEYQHMIHFSEKSVEYGQASPAWYNEMCSMVAEDLVAANIGLNPVTDGSLDRMPGFNYHYAESGVSDWLESNTLASYASAFAFGAYLERNYGGAPLFQAMLANNSVAEASVTAALASRGYSDTFADAFRHYGEALVYTTTRPSGSSVKFNNQARTDPVGTLSYTAVAFDLGAYQQYNYAAGWVASSFGPRLYTPSTALELRPYGLSIHSQTAWQSLVSNTLSVNLTAPADPDVSFYLMVK